MIRYHSKRANIPVSSWKDVYIFLYFIVFLDKQERVPDQDKSRGPEEKCDNSPTSDAEISLKSH